MTWMDEKRGGKVVYLDIPIMAHVLEMEEMSCKTFLRFAVRYIHR